MELFSSVVLAFLFAALATLIIYVWFRRHGGAAGDKQYNERLMYSTLVVSFLLGMFLVPCLPANLKCLFGCA